MRILTIFGGLLLICYVAAESCNDVSQCDHVICDASTELGCSNGECTCVYHSVTCVTSACTDKTRCGGTGCLCRNPNDHWHCFKEHCMCGFAGPTGSVIGK